LGFETGDHLMSVHSQLDDLKRDGAMDWSGLLSSVNLPHPALADDLKKLVGADHLTGPLAREYGTIRLIGRRDRRLRHNHHFAGALVRGQEGADLLHKLRVVAACGSQ